MMSDEQIDKLLSTRIPGGSSTRDWFLPHDTQRGLENVRDVVSRLVAAEREACAQLCDKLYENWRFGDGENSMYGPKGCAAAIRNRNNEN